MWNHTIVDGFELCSVMECFKFEASTMMIDFKTAAPSHLLKQNVQDIYPYIEIALGIFLTVPVTTANRERNFSQLKLMKKNTEYQRLDKKD